MSRKISVSHEFHGMCDYWGGNGRRWDDDAGCLFAHYDRQTTLRDCVDQWVMDYCAGGDCDSLPDDITSDDIREAIMTDLLNGRGRADYNSDALCEFAADCEDERVCRECGAGIGYDHLEGCRESLDDIVAEPDCEEEDDCMESPIWVILIEVEVCEDEEDGDSCWGFFGDPENMKGDIDPDYAGAFESALGAL